MSWALLRWVWVLPLSLLACSGSGDDAAQNGNGGAGGSSGSSWGGSGGAGGSSGGFGGTSSGGSAGAPLPCDPGFSFSANPATAGVGFSASYTNSTGYAYIDLEVSGPGTPSTSLANIGGSGPYTWSYDVSGHGSGILNFTFVEGKNGGAGNPVATCQIYSDPPGGTGGSGTGGSGTGGSGTGGSGTGGSGTGGSGGGTSCTTPITMIANPPLSSGSGWFFVLDFNCPNLQIVQSPIMGSVPNQSSYRSTLAKFLSDFNADGKLALAFNTNFSQTGADPITGGYVYQGSIYDKVYVIDCSYSGSCPSNCALEDTRTSFGVSSSGQVSSFVYNPGYDWNACQSQGCQGCNDYNWQINMPYKFFTGTNNGIIPPGTHWLVTGMDISSGVPHHGGVPDPFSESLSARNVMAKVKGENKLVVGLLSSAYRSAVKNYMVSTFNAENVAFFDGGGSTKQYINFQGTTRNLDGAREIPAIIGVKLQ